jgi:large subunit ribosomal protein L7/L12
MTEETKDETKKDEVKEEKQEEKVEKKTVEQKTEETPTGEPKEEIKTEEKPAEEPVKVEGKKEEPKPEPTGKFKDLIKEIEGLSVLELADLVKELEDRFGVSAAAPVAVSGGNTQEENETEEKTEFNIFLKASGEQKINVIKAVREITQLGLKDAKDLVDAAPKEVKTNVKKEEAEEIKKKLEAVGAEVELK